MSSGEKKIEDALDPKLLSLLKTFDWGFRVSWSHPNDRGRLFTFLTNVHLSSRAPDLDLLERWLREGRHWPPEKIHDLISLAQVRIESAAAV